jgi:ABC-2 type transport system permease protein
VLAVLTITNEYATKMIQTSLAAEPRRGLVLASKASVVTAAVVVAGALGVAGSVFAARNILPGNGYTAANGYPPLSLADGPTLRAAGGTVYAAIAIAIGAVAFRFRDA